jgi:hypothetical protein
MGMKTTIYGYIEEMDFWNDPIRTKVFEHNNEIFNSLPERDVWPPVSKEMFAICKTNLQFAGPNLEYRGRIIHFGANLKSVELEWEQWKLKFESFLTRLYFLEAVVHFKPEYSAIQTNEWSVNLLNYQVRRNDEMPDSIKRENWIYESTWEK